MQNERDQQRGEGQGQRDQLNDQQIVSLVQSVIRRNLFGDIKSRFSNIHTRSNVAVPQLEQFVKNAQQQTGTTTASFKKDDVPVAQAIWQDLREQPNFDQKFNSQLDQIAREINVQPEVLRSYVNAEQTSNVGGSTSRREQ